MLKEERFQYILRKLSEDQKVNLTTLSKALDVSSYTVRRDLKELTDKGLLQAVRGGAVPHSPTPHHFLDRLGYQQEQKRAIAAKAVSMVKDDQVIVLDSGTTALAIASMLPRELRITVVTNSFPVASVLESHPYIEVLFAGGRLYKSAFTTTGHDTIRFFRNIRADIYFMGICSIHHSIGVTTINYEEAEVKKSIVEVSKQVIALTPHERIDTAEAFIICPLEMVDTVITDDEGAAVARDLLAGTGITVL
ncbi:DeoR/GlpR family DNA-binding transcription regulator [Chryseolinea sp. T2]|uniref:DeoR/GlpR family DNA-binding transcription regulator n=1 Tax=Chryseolinea sp. T2 TaxID=3129255 RepID=UPI00307757B5